MAEMTHNEALEFLDSRPGWMMLSTIDGMGYPLTVPLGYFREDDNIYLNARGQRAVNVQRNPKISVLIEVGQRMPELRGLIVQGDGTLIDDPDEVLRLAQVAARWRGTAEADLPTEVRPGTTYIKLTPTRIRSWDNPKDARERA
ncbi:MAG TPA: pyridoxamine 5'-phosphate oxidase family protein [Dehalococcoidia bacterium]|nr:pyridoxamine 5'-phosphate oxidase family protein [Dehalococcoidia bacterium]